MIDQRHASLRGPVLVTGGTGFIGGRLIERLVLEMKCRVRVLVRNFASAARVATLPVDLRYGDVTDAQAVRRAAEGCSSIFHCAYGNSGSPRVRRAVNVEGARNALDAALAARLERLVFLSTVMVYGSTPEGDLDETAPRRRTGGTYGDSKLEAEVLAMSYFDRHRLPVAILQPTTVYGPYAPYWTTAFLRALKKSRIILIDRGEGICNAVYVDDVVSAMILAAVRPEAVGETFLISGPAPVTWREFFSFYEGMLGVSNTVSMSVDEAVGYYRRTERLPSLVHELRGVLRDDPGIRDRLLRTREAAFIKEAISALLPEALWDRVKRRLLSGNAQEIGLRIRAPGNPIASLDPALARFCSLKTRVVTDKAKRLMGYEAAFTLQSGMRLTEDWARWANLL